MTAHKGRYVLNRVKLAVNDRGANLLKDTVHDVDLFSLWGLEQLYLVDPCWRRAHRGYLGNQGVDGGCCRGLQVGAILEQRQGNTLENARVLCALMTKGEAFDAWHVSAKPNTDPGAGCTR